MAEPVAPLLAGWARLTRFEGEPLDAWAAALVATGVPPRAIDSLDVVYCQSWQYDDPPGRLASRVGATPGRLHYSGIGGTTPLELMGAAAERIAAGDAEVCAIVGGEALSTVRALRKAGERPQWSHRDPEKKPFPFEAPFHPSEVAHQVFQAYTTFAMRDIARRAGAGITPEAYAASLGELFAPMTGVAAEDPYAWFGQVLSPEEVATPSSANRMVAYPYTKRLTAIMDVDICSAVVLASPGAARRLGVDAGREVWVRGWASGRDPDYVAEHPDLARAPAMAPVLDGALSRAGVGLEEVERFDLYSCFPSSVLFALDALGLDPSARGAPWTVTGGLPYAGGPGSCYTIGSVAAMADSLLNSGGGAGLVTGVGMHLSKHAAVVLSTDAGQVGPPLAVPPADRVPIVEHAAEGTVAAYTVHHGPDGSPTDGVMVCDVDAGRCYAKVSDPGLLAAMEAQEWVGRRVRMEADGATNVVSSGRP